jgi:hypothetical protein
MHHGHALSEEAVEERERESMEESTLDPSLLFSRLLSGHY